MAYKDFIAVTRDSVATVREISLVIAVIVLLLYPDLLLVRSKRFNDAAKVQGAQTGEVAVGPYKAEFNYAAAQTSDLTAAQDQIKELQAIAEQVKANASSPQNAARAEQLVTKATAATVQLQQSIDAAKDTQLAADSAVQRAEGQTTGDGSYGIVSSADKTEDLASSEVQQLKARVQAKVAVYDRQGFLRTVARFDDASSANASLGTVQQYRKSAYVINLSKWCLNQTAEKDREIAGAPVIRCQ